MEFVFDLFISHAGEDKTGCVKPLVEELGKRGLSVWVDSQQIRLGDDFRKKMEEGLAESAFGVLILSPSYRKSWPESEMSALLSQEAIFGEKRILPVLYQLDRKEAARYWPFLASRASVEWSQGLKKVAQEIELAVRQRLDRSSPSPVTFPDPQTRDLSSTLDALYEQRLDREESGEETSDLDTEIVRIKREMREGGRLKPGDRLADRYKLLELLGQGGFAQVWKAYDSGRRDHVAVKVLHSQYGDDKSRRERFFRGARQMARLKDVDGIVDVIDEKCEDGGYFFYVMEFVAGGDFRQAVLSGKLSRNAGLRAVIEVGKALHKAHQRGVVHRDIKPANILLTADGLPKLTDFDLVRAADTTGGTKTSKLGTFVYAAPESMLDASGSTDSADVYGLGMTAIFVVHGDELPSDVVFRRSEFLGGLDMTQSLYEVLQRAVHPEKEQRWPSSDAFGQELRQSIGPATEPLHEPSEEASESLEAYLLDVPENGDLGQWRGLNSNFPQGVERISWKAAGVTVLLVFLLTLGVSRIRLRSGSSPKLVQVVPSVSISRTPLIESVLEMRFRYVPPGTFIMGSPVDEPGRFRDEVQRQVIISEGYWMGETEVTQAQWERLMGSKPSSFKSCGASCPVESVSWSDAVAFANALSRTSGFDPCYSVSDVTVEHPKGAFAQVEKVAGCNGYRLPTEAEWERAARGGTQSALYSGPITIKGLRHAPELDDIAWYGGNSRAKYSVAFICAYWSGKQFDDIVACGPQEVGGKEPNQYGLRDMLGNVWEWTEDSQGTTRVARGGSWFNGARQVRAAARYGWHPSRRLDRLGFRLSRSVAPSEPGFGSAGTVDVRRQRESELPPSDLPTTSLGQPVR